MTTEDPFHAAAVAAGAHDPDDVQRLCDQTPGTDAAAAVAEVQRRHPALFRAALLTRSDLASMTAEQITAARAAGELTHLLGTQPAAVPPPAAPSFDGGARSDGTCTGTGHPPRLRRDQLRHMTPDAIEAARAAGELDHLLGIDRSTR